MSTTQEDFYQWVTERNPHQPEFIQAVKEVTEDIKGLIKDRPDYSDAKVLQRLSEPDRIITFRVCWEDDKGQLHINRGWRVQFCGVIGPYKGGIRFHPTVNESILKFLAFEQTFKNALTGLPIGGAKGGSDFDPKGRSDREIMRFCQAFMRELHRHIGQNTDVPAGDINVGSREIGYLFGEYRRLTNNFSGALTGKDIEFGGSHVRLEATGFGLMYFVEQMLEYQDDKLKGKRIAVSGSGNVAIHAALKAIELGATVITLSSSQGTLYCEEGFTAEHIKALRDGEGSSTDKLQAIQQDASAQWLENETPWQQRCDIALPCATQNELDGDAAKVLTEQGCLLVAEGANMPCTDGAIDHFENTETLHAPGKASNAGGVALSGLEMGQNAGFTRRTYEDLDEELRSIMSSIHQQCLPYCPECEEGKQEPKRGQYINYRKGANIAAFTRVAEGLVAQGVG